MQNVNVYYFLPQEKWVQTCLVSARNWFLLNPLIQLPNITKVMGSLVTLGCCALKEPGLEFGVISEGSSKKQSGIEVTYPTCSLSLLSFRSCSLPASIVYVCYFDKTLLTIILFPFYFTLDCERVIFNIPFVYSIMEFVYLFYFNIFWTKIFVFLCWNVHTVNVC